jgi:hypothetical protein
MCLFCFSKERLSQDEIKGKYGGAFGSYANESNKFDISLCQTPCREPLACCVSSICICPAQMYMRHKVLNHVNPGSGWKDYKCCQGYFGSCCCFQPGNMGEGTCPVLCMCCEACLCTGPAVSATSMVIREKYRLGLDEDDVRLIRCSNCLFFFSICLSCISMFTECEGDDALASIVNCVSDAVFLAVSGCMTAQVNHEIKLRESSSPTRQMMDR